MLEFRCSVDSKQETEPHPEIDGFHQFDVKRQLRFAHSDFFLNSVRFWLWNGRRQGPRSHSEGIGSKFGTKLPTGSQSATEG